MNIRKVAKLKISHIHNNQMLEIGEPEVLEYKDEEDLISKIMDMDGLIAEEKTVRYFVRKSMEKPNFGFLQLTQLPVSPSGRNDALEYQEHGTPTEVCDLTIEHQTDIEVIIGGTSFKMNAVKVT